MKHQRAFTEDLAALLRAGTPLEQSLGLLEQHHPSTDFKLRLTHIKCGVQQGQNLSDVLSATNTNARDTFSPLFIGMIKSGEASGDLPTALNRLAAQLERDHNLEQKVKSALVYPCILIVGMFISLIVMFAVVIPQFAILFNEYGEQLSPLAKGLMAVGGFINQWGGGLLATIAIAIIWAWQRSNALTLEGQLKVILQRIPYLAALYTQIEYSRFCYSLSSLLQSGLSQTQALTISSSGFEQHSMQTQITQLIEKLNAGYTLGACFPDLQGINPLYAHSIANAETAGQLPVALEQLALRMEKSFSERTLRLTQVIEPTLVMVLGLLIGIIVYALFSSLASLGNLSI